ncbi:unnamed protein product [Rhizophagus irregularis]|nr:unnamed protein product [Rhizophagus irregularis]
MTNLNNNPGTPPRGEEFRPREPYTHRLKKLLEEYPDGTQVLREILQNSDDARSKVQTFVLDHNTYQSERLLEPHLNKYKNFNLNIDKYQGPALLAINETIFEENDFESLLSLADSKKQDQFDKIGVMGVGFNSIYHITDSPSFITGDKYVILDPHEWYYNGGVKFNFVEENLIQEYPDQFAPFAPFEISCNERFGGTIFRYPLRDSTFSNISKKIYETNEILKMFRKFYENESINCLLFLKHIECISFYELKEGASKPELLYKIQLDNAIQEGEDTDGEISRWLILNYLDDLLEAEAHFQEKFNKSIGDHKFIPNVGLAVPLNSLNVIGRLFCFLPLPIDMPFIVSVHGYFAVSNNRRSLWSAAGNEDLAFDGLANLKIQWNKYLFEKVLPKAWIRFLLELTNVADIQLNDIYSFWPRVIDMSDSINIFCEDLIKNVVENLNIEDRVFNGPSSNAIGYCWLSLSDGYLDEKSLDSNLLKIIGNIGFPVISVSYDIIRILQRSRHNDNLKRLSPAVIRDYLDLKFSRTRWEDDEIEVRDLISIIRDMNENEELSTNEIENVIEILKRVAKIQNDDKIEGNNLQRLDELLIPSTNNKLVELQDIYYDDMGDRLDDNEKSKYEITHYFVTRNIAEGLGIQTLKGKIFGN